MIRATSWLRSTRGWTEDLPAGGDEDPIFSAARDWMVTAQIEARGVRDPRVLHAMRTVPRHRFVPEAELARAYDDRPLPIGHQQTISQPYIVALMTELARPAASDRALEIGTGCGYQAAVLATLVSHVFSLELIPELAASARERLARLGVGRVTVAEGDGYDGWEDEAPFDIVLAGAAPEEVPPALVAQLAPGGRLVLPVGPMFDQSLVVVEKGASGTTRTRTLTPVRFVPLVHGRTPGATG